MLIPLGTDRALRRPTLITLGLIAVNVAIHLAMEVVSASSPDTARRWLTSLWLADPVARPWTLITSAFLHGGLLHLVGNMLFLWGFGPNVEDRFGRIGFLAFYLGGAAASGGLHWWIDRSPAIGASGAVAAITGAFLVLFPFTHIKAFLIFFIIGFVRVPALYLIGAQIAWEVLLRAWWGGGDNIARLAHLGGYGYGIAIATWLLWTRRIPREPFDLFTIGRQAARRRQFQEIKYAQERQQRKPSPPAGEVSSPLAKAREAVTRALDAGDHQGAVAAFRNLLADHGREGAVFARKPLAQLANLAFQQSDHSTAATAFEMLIEKYKNDPETPAARLMLGLVNARYLNDPIRARRELEAALPDLHEPEHQSLAKSLLDDLA